MASRTSRMAWLMPKIWMWTFTLSAGISELSCICHRVILIYLESSRNKRMLELICPTGVQSAHVHPQVPVMEELEAHSRGEKRASSGAIFVKSLCINNTAMTRLTTLMNLLRRISVFGIIGVDALYVMILPLSKWQAAYIPIVSM